MCYIPLKGVVGPFGIVLNIELTYTNSVHIPSNNVVRNDVDCDIKRGTGAI